jgi:hypothetical protein
LIKESFVGKIVIANYGNQASWRIEDIIFDNNLDTFTLSIEDKENSKNNQQPMSISQYYKTKYNLEVKDNK